MCGIVALLGRAGHVSREALLAATGRLAHRGPDGSGMWLDAEAGVGVGHTRLSIIDLQGGRQPIGSPDCRLQLVANGEFYDFESIRAELVRAGHRFATQSDSEIALHLYQTMGTRCLERLRGEFAFIIWDAARRRLFAARDRFGIKPLFYARTTDGAWVFASEAKALFAAGVRAAWDAESLFQHLCVCFDQDRSLFAGVHQVPPGHYALASDAGIEIVRYWDLDYPQINSERAASEPEEHIESVRAALKDAVRVRLRADTPVGCYLSGGVDSSAVLGMARELTPDDLCAFTVSFQHAAYDEAPVARESALAAHARFHPIVVKQNDIAEHISDAVWHGETLGINGHAVARYLQSKAVHQAGYKVVLSGDGADELFAGYIYSRSDYARTRSHAPGGASGRELLSTLQRSNPAFRTVLQESSNAEMESVRHRLGFVPSWLEAMATSRATLRSLLSRELTSSVGRGNPYARFLQQFDSCTGLRGRDPVLQSMYLWAKSILPNQVLFGDRMDMAHGVEVRMPFLDGRMAEVATRLPVPLLIHGLVEKHALREAARPYITRRVFQRSKQPFTAPHCTLDVTDPLFRLAQELLRGATLDAMPFFDRAAVLALLDRLPRMPERSRIELDQTILLLVSVCLLQERFSLAVA